MVSILAVIIPVVRRLRTSAKSRAETDPDEDNVNENTTYHAADHKVEIVGYERWNKYGRDEPDTDGSDVEDMDVDAREEARQDTLELIALEDYWARCDCKSPPP